jgi:hypothetical protein
MNSFVDTWKDRNGIPAYAYGLNVIFMATVQIAATYAYLQLDPEQKEKVEKLIKNYQWKRSKTGAASFIEAICDLLNPSHENSLLNNVLDNCCYKSSFYGHFGLNHLFAVVFLPILITTVKAQKKWRISVESFCGGRDSLFFILRMHREILREYESKGEKKNTIGSLDIRPFWRDFLEKATAEVGTSNEAIDYQMAMYLEVKSNYGRTK